MDQADLLCMMSQTRCSAASTVQDQPPSSSAAEEARESAARLPSRRGKLQTCDYSMLAACVAELKQLWVPAKLDQVQSPNHQAPWLNQIMRGLRASACLIGES